MKRNFISLDTILPALFLVICSILTFAVFTIESEMPDNPRVVLLKSPAGDVMFMHEHHFSKDGAAIECIDCHHKMISDSKTSVEMNCRTCHYQDSMVVKSACVADTIHPRCIGKECMTCHEAENCTFCHHPAK